MTHGAILKATDDQLKFELGLTKLGDRLSLRSFSEKRNKTCPESDATRKKKLLEQLEQKRAKKRPAAAGANRSETKTAVTRKAKGSRKVEIGWLHCEKQIRMKDGGGTRNVDIERSANYHEILKIAQSLFLPDGKCVYGHSDDMAVELADFKKETITDTNDFTLERYITAHKLSKVKLYLSTKLRSVDREDSDDSVSDDFDNLSERSVFDQRPFIGATATSSQAKLNALIDKAYEEVLSIDETTELPGV